MYTRAGTELKENVTSLESQSEDGVGRQLIHHFHIDHNEPCLPPPPPKKKINNNNNKKNKHHHCFQFLLSNGYQTPIIVVHPKNQRQLLCKMFEGIYQVHYGLSEMVNRPFPSQCPGLCFQSAAKCEAIAMEMIFHSHANKTYFHKKSFSTKPPFESEQFWNSEIAYYIVSLMKGIYLISLRVGAYWKALRVGKYFIKDGGLENNLHVLGVDTYLINVLCLVEGKCH